MAAPDPTFARSTSQSRSEATAARILDAAIDLFAAGTLAATPVADIARAAGVSVGGFYGRFRTKADLERAVAEAMLQRVYAPFEPLFAADSLRDADAREVVERFARALVAAFGGPHRDAARRVVLLVRSDADLPTSRAVRDSNARVQQAFAGALLARRTQIGHPDPEAAIAFADLAMSAAAREALLHAGTGLAVDEATLVTQLTELGCGYLRIPRSDAPSP